MSRRVALVAGGLLVAGAIGAAAVLVSVDREETTEPRPPSTTQAPVPAPREPTVERVRELAARVPPGNRVTLRARPGGRILARVGGRTEFGSADRSSRSPSGRGTGSRCAAPSSGTTSSAGCERPTTALATACRARGRPLAARAARPATSTAIERRISVAIGAPDTPTPTGEYYVTDKLPGADFGSYYGCCILALSGRQPNLPQGWSGGDRLAIHGSPTPTWGQAVSNGCFHASEADLRYLMKTVPLGTSVEIHA